VWFVWKKNTLALDFYKGLGAGVHDDNYLGHGRQLAKSCSVHVGRCSKSLEAVASAQDLAQAFRI
jgi:hypothetical protein